MTGGLKLSEIILISVVVFAVIMPGCVNNETGGDGQTTTTTHAVSATTSTVLPDITTTSQVPTTSTTNATTTNTIDVRYNLSSGEACSKNEQCLSGCCDSFGGRTKCQVSSFCTCKSLNEKDCNGKDCYWCIDRCQNEPCGDCSKYKRCLIFVKGDRNVTRVEISQGGNGSCRYNGSYEDASGEEGYCDRHEGTRIYGKCGSSPSREDCIVEYGQHCCYNIAQRRSFHSPSGDEYDLWCFECSKFTQ